MTCFHVQQETQNSAKERQKSRRKVKEEMKDNSNQPPLNLTLVIPVGVWH